VKQVQTLEHNELFFELERFITNWAHLLLFSNF